MNADTAEASIRTIECSVSIPRTNLRGLKATVRKLDRLGATVWLMSDDLHGQTVAIGEGVELDIRLPENKSFLPRTLIAIGNAIRVGDGIPGRLWVVIRFRSLQFRDLGAEEPGGTAASS
jgi:hypothetical protein